MADRVSTSDSNVGVIVILLVDQHIWMLLFF